MKHSLVIILFLILSLADIGAQENNGVYVTDNNSIYVYTGASNISGARLGAGYYVMKQASFEVSIGGALRYEGEQPLIISSGLNYQLNKKTTLINSLSMMVVYGKINSQTSQKKLSVSPTIGSIFKVYTNLNLFYRLGYFTTINHFKHSGIHFDAGVRYYLI